MIRFTYPDEDATLTDDEKISMLNEKLLQNPADAKSWNDLGVLYATQEKYDVARDAFIKAIQVDPTNGDFHRNLGLAFSKLDMHEMAVAEFDAYRKFDAMGGQDYWRLIGGAQLQAGMVDGARQTYTEGITAMEPDLGPEGFRLVLALNQLEVSQGSEPAVRTLLEKYTPAADAFVRANDTLEIPSRSKVISKPGRSCTTGSSRWSKTARSWSSRASRMRRQALPGRLRTGAGPGRPAAASGGCLIIRTRSSRRGWPPGWPAATIPKKPEPGSPPAKVHEKNRKLEEAVAAYEKAYEIEKMDDVRVAIGNLYMRLGNDQEASKWLKAGLGDGAKPEVIYNYAVSLMREKKYHAAIPSLKTVTRELPDMFQGWLALAQCYQATKQYSKAIAPYEKSLELKADPKLAFHLGSVSRNSKQYDKAIEAYLTALEMDPAYVKARYNLSLTYMDAGRYEEAAESFDQLVELEGASYRAYYSQGLSYYYLGVTTRRWKPSTWPWNQGDGEPFQQHRAGLRQDG